MSNINAFYNQTKCGVDVLDQLCHEYTVQRSTRRWPMAMFYNLINVAGVAAFVLYRTINGLGNERVNRKRKFLSDLSDQFLNNSEIEALTDCIQIYNPQSMEYRVVVVGSTTTTGHRPNGKKRDVIFVQ